MWVEIAFNRLQFHRRKRLVDCISQVTKAELALFGKTLLIDQARSLEVHIVSHQHRAE